MKCQILFSRKNKKIIISLLFAELAQKMVNVYANLKPHQPAHPV